MNNDNITQAEYFDEKREQFKTASRTLRFKLCKYVDLYPFRDDLLISMKNAAYTFDDFEKALAVCADDLDHEYHTPIADEHGAVFSTIESKGYLFCAKAMKFITQYDKFSAFVDNLDNAEAA